MSDMLSYIWQVRRFSLSLPQNDRIYEETTMYYCVGIGCPDPLGWYRDKPEDKRFYATCCIESEPLYVKSLDNGLVEVTSMTSWHVGGDVMDQSPWHPIRQLQLANLQDFPLVEFLSISFTHHIRILENTKDTDERLFYIRYCHNYKPTTDELPGIIKQQDLYHHQGNMPNNFLATLPDYKQAYRAIQMFKDEYLLDYINVEELGMHDEEVDERVIESNIVHNVKNFIMTFGRGFTFIGNQVHFDKLGHDHWIDLLFYNRDLRRTVVFELKRGNFKVAYLAQLSSYLRILNDDDRREGEEAPIGIILCKKADRAYVEYIMQDFRQPMGVATYKTADEMEPELLKVLPPKEELQRIFEESGNKYGDKEGSED